MLKNLLCDASLEIGPWGRLSEGTMGEGIIHAVAIALRQDSIQHV